MAKTIVLSLACASVAFEWSGNTLKWMGQTQDQIDEVQNNPEMRMNDYFKKQLEIRLEGEVKDEFLEEAYSKMTASDLVTMLDKFLSDAKKGK